MKALDSIWEISAYSSPGILFRWPLRLRDTGVPAKIDTVASPV